MTKPKKPIMTFSELVYAIQNRGKSMNLKESKPMALPKAEKKVEQEPASEPETVTEPVQEAKKPNNYADWLKKGKPGGGWNAPPAAPQPVKSASNIRVVKKKKK